MERLSRVCAVVRPWAARVACPCLSRPRLAARLASTSAPPPPPPPPLLPLREDRLYTVPNLLTGLRLAVLAPLAGHLILQADYERAAAVVALAGALDVADGYIARRFDQQSVIGSYLDPAADKVLLVACAVTMGVQGVLPAWLVGLVCARDVGLVGGSLALRAATRPAGEPFFSTARAASTREIAPTALSKANTFLQLCLVCLGLGAAAWGTPPPPRADAAALLRWDWRGGERARRAEDGSDAAAIAARGTSAGADAGAGAVVALAAAAALTPAAVDAGGGAARPLLSLLLPGLAVAVAGTTVASGAHYALLAARALRAVR